ncbi:MAG: penicillin acylase family protein [Bacteroidota bacterium]
MCRHCLSLALLLAVSLVAHGQAAQDLTLQAPDATTVEIDRDEWGVPRITAETETGVFFGQGFAAAQDRLFQMENFWRASTGRLAEAFGSDFVESDQLVRTFFYTPAERQAQFEALPGEVQTMLTSFKDGVNAYIDSVAANPAVYQPAEYAQAPFTLIGIEAWDNDKMVALMQFFMRRFGEAGGAELTRLAELTAQGQKWFDANRPINDPTAATTIPNDIPRPPTAHEVTYRGPAVDPAIAKAVEARRERVNRQFDALGVPRKFGSYASLIGPSVSAPGDVMLLGAPQMGVPAVSAPGDPDRAVTWECELLVGDAEDPALHIAGMTVPGIPGVIIGRTADRAWTLTSGVSDNVDTFIETTEDDTLDRYFFDGAFVDYEAIDETISVLGGTPVAFTHYRSVHGPVYADDLDNNQAFTWQYTFWDQELDMATAFYDLWKAETREEVEAVGAAVPMSFNLFLNSKDQDIRFWHIGFYPDRPDGADPRLPLVGDGSQEWDGIRAFAELPKDENPVQGYYVNWNNKPAADWDHGDIMPWAAGAGRTYDGVLALDKFVVQEAPLTFDDLKGMHPIIDAREYPGTYQQIVQLSETGSRAENMVPPGQSAFFNNAGVPSPHVADQWPLYQTYEMKPFSFAGANPVAGEPGAAPGRAPRLGAVYPNPPVGEVTRVVVEMPTAGTMQLEVIDVLGRTVATLRNGAMAEGTHELEVSTRDLGSGVYFVRLRADGQTQTRKLTVVR